MGKQEQERDRAIREREAEYARQSAARTKRTLRETLGRALAEIMQPVSKRRS